MAHFLMTGTIGSIDSWIRWDNGKVTGEENAMQLLKAEKKLAAGEALGQPHGAGPSRDRAHLRHMNSAIELVERVFDEVTSYSDSEPGWVEGRVY